MTVQCESRCMCVHEPGLRLFSWHSPRADSCRHVGFE